MLDPALDAATVDRLRDVIDETKPVVLTELTEVEPEAFFDLIKSVILLACEDFIILNPYSKAKSQDFVGIEGDEYATAENFIFNDIPSFGELGLTFNQACEMVDLDADYLKERLLKMDKDDPEMPKHFQLQLFEVCECAVN